MQTQPPGTGQGGGGRAGRGQRQGGQGPVGGGAGPAPTSFGPGGSGEIKVRVSNTSQWAARGVIVSVDTFQSLPFDVREKRTATMVFRMPDDTTYEVLCRPPSTHSVDGDNIKDVAVRKRVSSVSVRFNLKFKGFRKTPDEIVRGKKYQIRQARRDYWQRAVKSILLLLVGVMVSAVLGSMWFTLSFIFFAVHFGLPPAPGWRQFQKNLEEIRERYEGYIRGAQARGGDDKLIDRLHKRMEQEMKAEQMTRQTRWFGIQPDTPHAAREFLRELFKGGGFFCLSMGFITSVIPAAPVIGIIVGFIGYFLLGGKNYHRGKEGQYHINQSEEETL